MTSRRAPWRAGQRTVLEPVDLVWALYARISDAEDEVGVTAQLEELEPFALGLGGRVGEVFPENDTSAYKRRPYRLPDGTTGYRVMRPHWDRMLTGLRSGRF